MKESLFDLRPKVKGQFFFSSLFFRIYFCPPNFFSYERGVGVKKNYNNYDIIDRLDLGVNMYIEVYVVSKNDTYPVIFFIWLFTSMLDGK